MPTYSVERWYLIKKKDASKVPVDCELNGND